MPRKAEVRQWLARAGVAVTLLLAVALAIALYAANQRSAFTEERVSHTEQVLATIGAIREQLALLESNARGFLLTEDRAYLGARDDAIGRLRANASALPELVSDNPGQAGSAAALQARLEDRIALAQRTLELYRNEGIESARSFFLSGAPERTTAEILTLVDALSTEEDRLLDERRAAEQRELEASRRLLAAAIAVAVLVLVPGFVAFLVLSGARGRAEARLRDIAASLPGAVFELRRHGDGRLAFEFVSPRAEAVLGVRADALVADFDAARERILADDLDAFDAALEGAARTHAGFELDFRVALDDGPRWIHCVAMPTPLRGEGQLWTGYWSDISERKRDEVRLQEALQRLEDAQRLATMGDWSYDFGSGKVQWSRALFDLLERDPALGPLDFEGSVALFGADGGATIRAAIERAISTRELQRYELHYTRRDGSPVALDTIAVPVLDADGHVTGLRGAMQDVSARRALEDGLMLARDEADRASRAKSQFLATMSHQLRTPMYGILGMLELLGLTPLSDDQRESVEVVWESGRSLQRIIDDILDYSNIEAGRLEIRPEATSVRRLVDGLAAIYSGTASSRGLALRHHVDRRIGAALLVDGPRLRQILGNLVSNSLKFTERGHVEIRAEWLQRDPRREQVRFVVEDSGVGMPAELVEQAFVPFAHAEQPGVVRERGTGLGLAICARLAELMGGRIRIESRLGRGTRMELDLWFDVVDASELSPQIEDRVDLPVARSGRERRKAPTIEVAESLGRLVLVVDDHPINRLVLQSQLGSLGYAAESVESGDQALEALQRRRYGLVITDCNMPGISGYDLSRFLRERERAFGLPRTPIIACTANASKGEYQNCIEAGMDDYLAKPTGLPRLLDKLHRWIPLEPREAGEAREPVAAGKPPEPAVVLDREALRRLTGGQEGATSRVLGRFKQVNDRDLAALLAAVEASDLAEIARCAHRMKGAAQLIGARALAAACARLEAVANDGDMMALGEVVARLRQNVETLDELLRTPAT